jgi:hypothetical protein
MGTTDYHAVIAARSPDLVPSQVIEPCRADWDPALAASIATDGVAFEEALLPNLLADLALGQPHHCDPVGSQ